LTTYRPVSGALVEVLGGRSVILGPAGNELVTLNPVGSVVWESLATSANSDLASIVECVLAKTDARDRATVERDVQAFLDHLVSLGLVSVEATAE
jgi:hypothetical protein